MRASPSKPGFLLFDLPSDHEVAASLSTECKVVEAILHNRGLARRITRHRFTSRTKFRDHASTRLNVRFVHLAGHANEDGIGFLRGGMSWEKFAEHITGHLQPLDDEQRVVVFSCCNSADGFNATKKIFRDYFTAAYLLNDEKVDFSDAITIWAMFYLKKTVEHPHKRIVDPINQFFGRPVLEFHRYQAR
jgi:hypothetical protein